MTSVEKGFPLCFIWQKIPGGESGWPKFGCEPVSNARGQGYRTIPFEHKHGICTPHKSRILLRK